MLRAALRIFFRWLYHRGAWSYDLVAAVVSLGRWRAWVLSVLPYLHGTRVLEIGYGTGHVQAALRERGVQIFGLDASIYMARQAKKRLLRAEKTHRTKRRQRQNFGYAQHTLAVGLAGQAPFPAHAFDQIVATFPSEYIFQADTLHELRRLLTPDGEVLILPMAWLRGNQPLERAAAALFRITGQSAPQDTDWQALLGARFASAGFTLKTEMLSTPGSTLLLLRLRPIP
ncbi:MAG: methyltransferase domain-containing protein [Anaerolineae bacterium]|nr:MAG: methyltransferase domain-containing protein [Anaerolineae bacterium]